MLRALSEMITRKHIMVDLWLEANPYTPDKGRRRLSGDALTAVQKARRSPYERFLWKRPQNIGNPMDISRLVT